MEKEYNKLVRDRIPDIIIRQGSIPVTHVLSDDEYLQALNQKLKEEVEEYLNDNSVEELCDVLEVVKAISSAMGISDEDLEASRDEKCLDKGAFKNKILLQKVITKD